MILQNIQGLNLHAKDMRQDQRYVTADIICVTETWLTPTRVVEDIHLPGFMFHSKPQQTENECLSYNDKNEVFSEFRKQQHGGVGLYHRDQIDCSIIDLPCPNIECLLFTIAHLNTVVAIVYRPPSYSLPEFCNKLVELIDHVDSFHGGKMILEDFNENLFVSRKVANVMQEHSFIQIVKGFTTEGGTLIDHIYIKDINHDSVNVHITPVYFSYHQCVQINYFY